MARNGRYPLPQPDGHARVFPLIAILRLVTRYWVERSRLMQPRDAFLPFPGTARCCGVSYMRDKRRSCIYSVGGLDANSFRTAASHLPSARVHEPTAKENQGTGRGYGWIGRARTGQP